MSDIDFDKMTDEEIQRLINKAEADLKGEGGNWLQRLALFQYDLLFPRDKDALREYVDNLKFILESRRS
jgi:hypothetical protein